MTATPRLAQHELGARRWAAPCFMGEGLLLMLLGLVTVLAPRFANVAPELAFGCALMLSGALGAAVMAAVRDQAHPAWWGAGAAVALAAGALALAGPFADLAAFPSLAATWLAADALALAGVTARLRRSVASGWGWLLALAAFDVLLSGWLVAFNGLLNPAAVGDAVAARFIIGGMAFVGLGTAALAAP